MGIFIDEAKKLFTLQTNKSTYQMKIGKLGNLLHLYYGAKIANEDLSYLLFDGESHFAPYPHGTTNRTGSLDILPQEFPSCGTGDFRSLGFDVENSDGTHIADLKFKSYEFLKGKYKLESLPTFYATSDDTVESIKITLIDEISGVEVRLYYAVFEEKDIITRAVRVKNTGKEKVTINKLQSVVLDIPQGDFELLHFHGRWAMERQKEFLSIRHGMISFGSNYGVSGNRQNPGFIIMNSKTTENHGECYGFNLVYSGNFTATAEQASLGQTRITLGLGDSSFAWVLKQNEIFEAPEAVMTFSNQGLTKVSQNFHDLIRENLYKGEYVGKSRPVLINNWEATYFDFTGKKLISLAESAKEIGADLLVMDDGWFGNRNDDNRALGDWFVNEKKLGMPLSELSMKINGLGLKFGIWIEPEMISEDSDLYRSHPEWALKFPKRKPLLGRNQLVLDLSKKEVRDYIFKLLIDIFDSVNLEYVKWDMNRPISDWYSNGLASVNQGELQHRYILGLYDLMEKLTKRYPSVLFEGCASGGARFDLGMLAFQPQIWSSDNTDPINRLNIQQGTSYLYPISTMGSHVSISPNHQNGRTTPFDTRINVAMSGTFGYELDVEKLSDTEKKLAKRATEKYKKYQNLIFEGDYYRLETLSNLTAWQIVSKNRKKSLVTIVATELVGNPPFNYIRLHGLDADATYESNGKTYKGDSLMNAGIRLAQSQGDYPSEQIYLKRLN
ncbi:alpha-galactosidase [Lactococcus lactis]|uniref:Alpha-galactosidase n=1 Tax=Lactococcus lactis TaxID=1358 RepID=A0A9X4S2F9_9LACT|nr:alpha-galactosidase [Lactococcus lactis]MDG4981428.1 alpha-galactosidase [Lactococcus lactis]